MTTRTPAPKVAVVVAKIAVATQASEIQISEKTEAVVAAKKRKNIPVAV
jgi:hypothetical protein